MHLSTRSSGRRATGAHPIVRAGTLAATALLVVAAGACSSSSSPSTQAVSTSPATNNPAGTGAEQFTPIRVLVSNDDGVAAPGIDVMVEALRAEPNVTVVVSAPAANQSGSGGKTTPGTVVGAKSTTKSGYGATAVPGFPADSVNWALDNDGGQAPDVLISGINLGQNLGPAVDLSGTVGAARAAAQRGIPAVAVSAGIADAPNYDGAAAVVIDWFRANRVALAAHQLPVTVTSFNEPTCPTGAVRGLVQVPAAKDANGRNIIATADCTSTVTNPADDVDAFNAGFTTESDLPLKPAA
jgi:5'-nucleotidase